MVTVVTEGIYSYCGVKLKIDTDRHLGPECATVRVEGEPVGHVTTGEYGSQMLSLGGVNHLTHGGKKEGRVTCEALLDLCNGKAVEMAIDGGSSVIVQAGRPPIVNGAIEERMRVGCGSATIGMFAKQWFGKVDEVVVVDDHITGVLSEHQAGKLLGITDTGIKMKGRRSTPGRYFHVAEPGAGWGGTNVIGPAGDRRRFRCQERRAAGPAHADGLDDRRAARLSTSSMRHLRPSQRDLPDALRRIGRAHQARIASRLCARFYSWAAPADRCVPVSRKIRCGSPAR